MPTTTVDRRSRILCCSSSMSEIRTRFWAYSRELSGVADGPLALRATRRQLACCHYRNAAPSTNTAYLFRNLFSMAGLESKGIHGIVISSVVPPLDSRSAPGLRTLFQLRPLFIEPGREDRHAGALRQSRGSGRGSHRERASPHSKNMAGLASSSISVRRRHSIACPQRANIWAE